MEVNLNNTYYGNNSVKSKTNINLKADIDIVKDNPAQEQTGTEQKTDKVKNFASLCKQFPDIAFVVVDSVFKPVPEYNGICNTSGFGDLDKVSIRIDEKVIEKLNEDFDNIVRMIQYKSDNYSDVKNNATASGCKYTAADLCYDGPDLVYMQLLCPGDGASDLYRETGFLKPSSGDDTDIGINEKYFQAFLLNIQYETYDKLFDIGEGEDEKKYTAKSERECTEKYQKYFIYE